MAGHRFEFTPRGDAPPEALGNAADMAANGGLTQLIEYRCVRAEHLGADATDRVFVNTGGWAYCPAGRRAEDHAFIPTGGLDRRRLERGAQARREG